MITSKEYKEAVNEMFNAARCALWHVTEHPDWKPCGENDKCVCENYEDAMSVLIQTAKNLLKKVED